MIHLEATKDASSDTIRILNDFGPEFEQFDWIDDFRIVRSSKVSNNLFAIPDNEHRIKRLFHLSPSFNCSICGGRGYYEDYYPYGDTWVSKELTCECITEQVEHLDNFDNILIFVV